MIYMSSLITQRTFCILSWCTISYVNLTSFLCPTARPICEFSSTQIPKTQLKRSSFYVFVSIRRALSHCHVASFGSMSFHVAPCCILSFCITSFDVISSCVMSNCCHVVRWHFMMRYVIHCHLMSRPTMSFHDGLCHFKLHLIMLRQVNLHLGISRTPSYRNVVYFVSCFCVHLTLESCCRVLWLRPFDFWVRYKTNLGKLSKLYNIQCLIDTNNC